MKSQHPHPMLTNRTCCALITFAILANGCSNGIALVPVKGTVSLDGKPLADARVIFSPEEGGRPSSGFTDDDGTFELTYIEETRGALKGKHKVSISTYVEADPDSSDSLTQAGQKEVVPDRYNTKTTLDADIESATDDLAFDLKTTAS